MEIPSNIPNSTILKEQIGSASVGSVPKDAALKNLIEQVNKALSLAGDQTETNKLKDLFERLLKLLVDYKRRRRIRELFRKELLAEIKNPKEWIIPWYKKKK